MPRNTDDSSGKEYDQIMVELFRRIFKPGATEIPFTKKDIEQVIADLGLEIRNVPDVAYTYRSGRSPFPDTILEHGQWAIDSVGKGKYVFVQLARSPDFDLPEDLEKILIPDSTPQVVLKYLGTDEQAMLSRLRYNRLIDTFVSLTAYHIQGHFRTTVQGTGQIEIDDLYLGVNESGEWFALPVEGKVGEERLGVVQIRAMTLFAREQYPDMSVRPIGVKQLADDSVIMVEFNNSVDFNTIATRRYKRYELIREI